MKLRRWSRSHRSWTGDRRAIFSGVGLMIAALVCQSCGGSEADTPVGPTLVPMPPAALSRCMTERLRVVCPTRIPDSRWRDRPGWDDDRGNFAWNGLFFELQAGAQHPGQPQLDRPPRFVHVAIGAGEASALLPFAWRRKEKATLHDGLLRGSAQRSVPLLFGARKWGGVEGELVLAPPHEGGGGVVGDHLIFGWEADSKLNLVTIHAWEPLEETEQVLRQIVESIQH